MQLFRIVHLPKAMLESCYVATTLASYVTNFPGFFSTKVDQSERSLHYDTYFDVIMKDTIFPRQVLNHATLLQGTYHKRLAREDENFHAHSHYASKNCFKNMVQSECIFIVSLTYNHLEINTASCVLQHF